MFEAESPTLALKSGAMPRSEGWVAELTNSRQLLAEHDVQDARAADLGLHQHHAGVIGNDLANHGSFAAQRVLAHALDNFVRCLSGNDGDQLAFVGDIKRIESQNFASAFDRLADGNIRASCNSIPTFDWPAISFKVVATPPRVGSRRQWIVGRFVAARNFKHYIN